MTIIKNQVPLFFERLLVERKKYTCVWCGVMYVCKYGVMCMATHITAVYEKCQIFCE